MKQLARPKMRDANIEMILQLVEENAKQRFEVMYGYDPSPIRPKSTARSRTKAAVKTEPVQRNEDVDGAMDAATIEDAKVNLAKSDQSEPKTELPLVIAPFPNEDGAGPVEGSNYEYFIRATQGHSLKLESTAHLTTVFDDDEGLQRIGLMVHGTRWDLWESISTSLSQSTTDWIMPTGAKRKKVYLECQDNTSTLPRRYSTIASPPGPHQHCSFTST